MTENIQSIGILLGDNMLKIFPLMENAFNVADLDINCSQFRLLIYLSSNEDLILNDMALTLGKDKSTIMRQIDHLEHQGFVVRKPDPKDRRKKKLLLTKNGHKAYLKGRSVEQQVFDQVFGNVAKKDMDVFCRILQQINKNL